jgi:hypothetical protein
LALRQFSIARVRASCSQALESKLFVNVKYPRQLHDRGLLAIVLPSLPGFMTYANVGNLRAITVDVEINTHE